MGTDGEPVTASSGDRIFFRSFLCIYSISRFAELSPANVVPD